MLLGGHTGNVFLYQILLNLKSGAPFDLALNTLGIVKDNQLGALLSSDLEAHTSESH